MTYLRPAALACCCILAFAGCESNPQEEASFQRTANEVIVRQDSEPDRLNPVLTTSGYSRQVFMHVFQYLLTQHPTTLEYIPQLAKGRPEVREVREGPHAGTIAYTYELFEEARWDDGRPVTAEDYVFTLKCILNPKVPAERYRPYLGFFESIEISGPKTFTAYLKDKYILGEEVVHALVPVLPAHLYDPEGLLTDIPFETFLDAEAIAQLADTDDRLQRFAEQFSAPALSREPEGISGSGPYELAEWSTGQRIVLKRKTDWWGDELPGDQLGLDAHPDKLIFMPIPEDATVMTAIKSEELDAASRLESQTFIELKASEEVQQAYTFHSPLALESIFLYLNTESPKLSDKRVRRALAHAINVEEIIAQMQQDLAQASFGPVHPTASYLHPELKPLPYDLEKAKSLLEEAGWTDSNNNGIVDKEINGEQVELELELLITANRETSRNMGLLIQNGARQVGLQLELVPKEFSQLIGDTRTGAYEMATGGSALPGSLWDPSQHYHTSKGDNRTGFGNAQTDALIDSIRVTLDEETRKAMYLRLQEVIYEEQPQIFLYVPKGRVVVHKRFDPVVSPIFPNFYPNLFELDLGS